MAIAWDNRLQDAICEIVKPTFWPDEPIFIYAWRARQSSDDKRNRVSCDLPSQHQFLEAQLELRDFLRPHLSADEIEALMRAQ